MDGQFVLYQRKDCRWDWQLIGRNAADIVATSGNQGYENKADAQAIIDNIKNGFYAPAPISEVPNADCKKAQK